MKRQTLDRLVSGGGIALAALLLVIGFVMSSNATFARSYVHRQLAEQKIAFPPAEKLSPEELASTCVAANAGKQVLTGKQAECYANEFIGLHVTKIAEGKTYAELGGVQAGLKAQLATASPADKAGIQANLDAITGQRETLFKGETLRGLLLTTFGFSTFGVKAAQAATVAFLAAALVALLSIAGLWHAMRAGEALVMGAAEPAPVPMPAVRRTRTRSSHA